MRKVFRREKESDREKGFSDKAQDVGKSHERRDANFQLAAI